DDVEPDVPKAVKAPQQRLGPPGREATDLGRSRRRGERRVDEIDVERQKGLCITDSRGDALRDGGHAKLVRLGGGDHLQSHLTRNLIVTVRVDGTPETHLDRTRRFDEAFLERVVERRPVGVWLVEIRLARVAAGV